MAFSHAVLLSMGVPEDEAREISEDVRRRDEERLELQVAGDIYADSDLMHGNMPTPAPFTKPKAIGTVSGNVPNDLSDVGVR